MCGICGYYSYSGYFSSEDLKQMTGILKHRGPDAEGTYYNNIVGLGHRRLSIIDLSENANQPMHSQDNRYVISYNGEIYNFKEISGKLRITPKTTSDTEIIIEAFAKLGVKCVTDFNGMFAIAIYDKKEETLYLFRDRIGIKPIYYYYDGNNLAFASELKSLISVKNIQSRLKINKSAISLFLYLGYIPEPHSIYQNIYKLPAGSFLKVKKNKISISTYWSPEEQITTHVLNDFKKATSEFKDLITDSVRMQLVCDVPYGIFLSGGTDSSLIAAIAKESAHHKIKTFTIGFKEKKYNEAHYARTIADYLDSEHYEFILSHTDCLPLLDEINSTYDEPFADSSAIPTMLVSQLARKYVKMVLCGDGGDELFLGYGSYQWAKRLSNKLVNPFRHTIAFVLSHMTDRGKRASYLFSYLDKQKIKSHIASQEQYCFSEKEIDRLLTDNFRTRIELPEMYSTNRKLYPEEEQALFDIKYYLKDDLLVKVDRATMKYGLEARVPFLDYRIVSFALNLSKQLKNKNGIQKYLLKETLYDFIPKKYFNRPKWGFSIPIRLWLKNELENLSEEYLSKKVVTEFGIVNYDEVKKIKFNFSNGHSFLFQRIWILIVLHKFFKNSSLNH